MSMGIRECSPRDLAHLHASLPGDVYESHYARQRDGSATYLVAWADADPLGWAMIQWHGCVGINARAEFPEAVEVNHLQVRREHRGQGVGRALMAAAEGEVWRRSRGRLPWVSATATPEPHDCTSGWAIDIPESSTSANMTGRTTMARSGTKSSTMSA